MKYLAYILGYVDKIPMMKSLPETVKISFLAIVGVILWLVSGVLMPSGPALEVPASIAEKNGNSGSVKVVSREISPSDFRETLSLRGYTKVKRSVSVSSETSGIIEALPVREGEKVKKGQLICRIRVGAREARLSEAEALMRAKEIDLKAAEKLVEKGHFSLSRAAAAQAAFDTAKALVVRRKIELERTFIRAPFDGVLDVRDVELGDFITVGQPCGTVIDKNPLKIVTQISEKQVGVLRPGAKGRAVFATGEAVEGVVSYIAEKAAPVTRTFRMEMEVDNSDYSLRDGVSSSLEVEVGVTQAYLLPHGIITLEASGDVGVMTVSGNRAKFTPITILSDGPEGVWIKGLQGTQKFITVGQEFVSDGQRVLVTETPAQAGLPPDGEKAFGRAKSREAADR